MRKYPIIEKIISLLLVCVMTLSFAACSRQPDPEVDPVNDNYRTFYQIFVGSFSDSNGDGIGDLRGIINRFDYLNDGNIHSGKSLGVQGIWLSPIFSSPSYHKYDARNYYKIDPDFGTEEDLKELIALCHERNVKIILDVAINHTSDTHAWFGSFREARQDGDVENKYYDYYSCVTESEKKSGITYRKVEGAPFYYECNFSSSMPELNFDNEDVREETLNIAKYYLDLGIDGFRFDAIKYIYFGETERSADFWEWYMGELLKYKPDIYTVGECWSGESEILSYYGAMNCFNFAMSGAEGYAASAARGTGSISTFTGYIESYQKKLEAVREGSMMMSFLSNHDMDRIAGAFIHDGYSMMAANLYLLLPGSPTIYYGEEIGMRGSRGSASTDANRRLAMLWGDGDTIRNPIGSSYSSDKQIDTTVAEQIEDKNSLYNYYCRLIAIRHRYAGIARGTYTAVKHSSNLGGFLVEYGDEDLLILHNTGEEAITVELSELRGLGELSFGTLAEAIGSGKARLKDGQLTIDARTSVILK